MHNFPFGFQSRSCSVFCSSRTRLIIWRKKTLRVGVSSPPAMLKSVGKRRNFLTWAALLTTLEFVEFRLICTTSNDEASVSIFSQGKPLLSFFCLITCLNLQIKNLLLTLSKASLMAALTSILSSSTTSTNIVFWNATIYDTYFANPNFAAC